MSTDLADVLADGTHDLWCCPRCHGGLSVQPHLYRCGPCAVDFPVIAGIPDLRVALPAWVDVEADRDRARELDDLARRQSAEDLIRYVFRRRAGWSEAEVERRSRQILDGVGRARREVEGWLGPATSGATFVDLGCGAGQLLAGAAWSGRHGIGIDVTLEWLVVARRLVVEHGGRPRLAAAMAEALPLRTATVDGVVSLDVIEHVGDQAAYVREIARALRPGRACAFATPNRFSLAPEPHVGVWGVGWLPRRHQAPYVRWRSGKRYDYCRLLSARELRRLLRTAGLDARVTVPQLPPEEVAQFGALKRWLAGRYNAVVGNPISQPVMARVGAFFQVLAWKAG